VELADTSVWARRRQPAIRVWFETGILEGEIWLCDMVAMELLHSASTPEIYVALQTDLRAMPWLHMDMKDWDRALQVQALLAVQGKQLHRLKPADLLIAACAERYDMQLVHYDRDYDTIASVTGQSVRWVATRGNLDRPRQDEFRQE
jgi:predicted nucleic acid-binding protein